MKHTAFLILVAAMVGFVQASEPLPCQPGTEPAARKPTLTAFAGEDELTTLIQCFKDDFRRRQEEQRRREAVRMQGAPMMQAAPAPAAPAAASKAAAAESITNTQTVGVDEGGIVKAHGDHLVILRRGRLFTVKVGGDQLQPVSAVDAFAPDVDPRGAWYDEMLIAGDTIAVIGYSYQRGGTEIGLFDLDAAGVIKYRATYHLRSNDYYSSRNYASRLIGSKLVFYTPLHINFWSADPLTAFPAVRRWYKGAKTEDFKRIAPATRIYRTDDPLDPYSGLVLHTVSVCDLATPELSCEATGVLGPAGRVFYVSAGAVYVWTAGTASNRDGAARSAVFRMPLDGSAPSALKAAGAPVDQFSFLESDDGHLNVLVRARGRGDAMWAAEASAGDVALLRVPLARFGDGREAAPADAYRRLPNASGYTVQNRFIANYLLYGSGKSWRRAQPGQVEAQNIHAVRWDQDRTAAQTLPLAHSIDRIEAMGSDAVVVGTQGNDLIFSTLALGRKASFSHLFIRRNAAQGETRSHGFFYKSTTGDEGLIGLPITSAGRPGYRQLVEGSAAVLFLRNRALKLTELGALEAHAPKTADDGCRASCVDWYGNARPIFRSGRFFALMGYELVEGRVVDGRGIVEKRRVSFAPYAFSENR